MSKQTKVIELSEERELRTRISAEFDRLFGPAKTGVRGDLERLLEIKGELAERNALYEEFDLIVLRLSAKGFRQLDLESERIELIDNFSGKNTAWTSAAVKRFDLKVESHEKRNKREARKEKAK